VASPHPVLLPQAGEGTCCYRLVRTPSSCPSPASGRRDLLLQARPHALILSFSRMREKGPAAAGAPGTIIALFIR